MLAAVTVALLAAGCAHASGPGVAVQKLDSDIEFGLPASSTGAGSAAIPPSLAPESATGPGVPLPAFDYSTVTTFDFGGAQFNGGSPSEQQVCPAASYGASPAKAVSTSVSSPPKPGSYKWQIFTTHPVTAGSSDTFTETHYVTYYIDHVTKPTTTPNPHGPPTTTFTFDVVSPGQNGGKVRTTYQVKENAPQSSVAAGNVGQQQTVGSPDRGLALKSVVDTDASGKVTSAFNPQPAVLLLPLDVQVPESFQGAGVDPTTGASFSVAASVSGKTKRVNACGDLVDGWDVTGTESFTAPGGQNVSSNVEYAVATQYGGLLTYQKTAPNGSTSTEEDVIGQLQPGPLPASEQ